MTSATLIAYLNTHTRNWDIAWALQFPDQNLDDSTWMSAGCGEVQGLVYESPHREHVQGLEITFYKKKCLGNVYGNSITINGTNST